MNRPQRFAAPGPATTEDEEAGDVRDASQDHMDAMCLQWAAWGRSRRFFGPPPLPAGVLGKLTRKSSGKPSTGGPDAPLSPEMSALNLAIAAQPMDGPRTVFELHYLHQVRNIKLAASQIGISRATWYRYLADFRAHVYAASHRILAENLAQAQAIKDKHAETQAASQD
jgi:hypothetical protein